MVGSVHYIEDISIDSSPKEFEQAMDVVGGLEPLAIRYYERVAEMVRALNPEVVGHLDLIRKNGHLYGLLDTPAIRGAADAALEVVRDHHGILDLNTAGWRKGLDSPYPAPWLVQRAREMTVPFCFGDDSHGPDTVGAGIDDAQLYLMENGVQTIVALSRTGDTISRSEVSLA
jgi:histidinol-phosphatase (PHP family)